MDRVLRRAPTVSGVGLVDVIGGVGVVLCFVYAFVSGHETDVPRDEWGETDADVRASRARLRGCVTNGLSRGRRGRRVRSRRRLA